jgi:hypothetical protein
LRTAHKNAWERLEAETRQAFVGLLDPRRREAAAVLRAQLRELRRRPGETSREVRDIGDDLGPILGPQVGADIGDAGGRLREVEAATPRPAGAAR